MAEDFLGKLLGNAPRSRLLRVFAFNPSEAFTLSHAAKRAGTGVPVAQREIRALAQLSVLKRAKFSILLASGKRVVSGKQKEDAWMFNESSKFAGAIVRFVHEVSPVEYRSVVSTLKRSGRVSAVILSGSFVGDPSRPADLIVAADALNERRLEQAIKALEPQLGREIRYAAFSTPEFRYRLTIQDRLMRDTLDFPHLVLLDRLRLL